MDDIQSVAMFIYHDIQWGREAQIGFNAGDGVTSFSIPEALSNRTLNIDGCSRDEKPGIFAFPIDSKLVHTIRKPGVFPTASPPSPQLLNQ